MKKSSLISLLLASVMSSFTSADITREDFIDQLDSANCSQVPPEIYLDTNNAQYDFASALSLGWISLTSLADNLISEEELAEQWNIRNIDIIENAEHDLKILIADYQDTVLVTFRHTDSNKNWLYNADYGRWSVEDSFSLGEKTHHGLSRVLSAEWDTLLEKVGARTNGKKLWLFGHSLGGALAQLSAAGFENKGLHVDQVYLTGAPKVGSQNWVEKAALLLEGRVHRLVYEKDLIAHLPVHNEALNDFRSISSIVPTFIANTIGGVRSTMKFDTLGQQVSLDKQANVVLWDESDSVSLEKQYWQTLASDLVDAKQSSWNPVTQVNRMVSVVSGNMENHLLRSEDGYFCAIIKALENEI